MMTQYVTCRIGPERFGLPLRRVREIINVCPITAAPQGPGFIRGLINLRGLIVTIIDLAARLELPSMHDLDGAYLIILRTGEATGGRSNPGDISNDESLGLLVEEIGDVVEMDTDVLEPTPANMDLHTTHLVRGIIRTDWNLYSVLDLDALLCVDQEVTAGR